MMIDEETSYSTPTCDMCSDIPSSSTVVQQQLWQCLDPNCGMVLCGQSSKNHSQYHFEVTFSNLTVNALLIKYFIVTILLIIF